MAAIDLEELIPDVKAAVDAPGTASFPTATNAQWLAQLRNAFWEAKLNGFVGFANFQEADGSVTPISGTDTLSRELQQIIIFLAAAAAVRNKLFNLNTSFRAKAGPVEYETQQSAQVFKVLLDDLKSKLELWLLRLSDSGGVDTAYFDGYIEREYSLRYGDGVFVSGGE
jgi:hypothetical protein